MQRSVLLAGLGLLAATIAQVPGDSVADESAPSTILASSLTPGVGQGDFEFYVDVAGIRRAADGRTITRILVQFPARAILDQTDRDQAELRVRALVYDGEEAVRRLRETAPVPSPDATERENVARGEQNVQDVLADFGGVEPTLEGETRIQITAPSRAEVADTDYRLAEIALEIAPGAHVVEVLTENLSRKKRGLLDRLRNRQLAATARVLVRIPDLTLAPALSDPVFRIGHNVRQDYATRVYGLLNDSLHVRTIVYGQGETQLRWVARDRVGEVHWQDSLVVDVSQSRDVELSTSVNTLPAGQYVLTVTATNAQAMISNRRSFDVAWSMASWHKSRRDLDLEAEIVLTGDEFQTYSSLPLGEKERYMDGFWANQDPTPDTAYNEVLQEFHRRVAFADATYGETVRGALTDRGKIYIRFGPPQEVQSEAVPSHLAGKGADGLIEKVEDPYTSADEELHGFPSAGTVSASASDASAAEAARLTAESSRVIGLARELTAYELWVYAGTGLPLLERDVIVDTGFRVLFVDTQGFGEYRVRKASATFDIPGLQPSY